MKILTEEMALRDQTRAFHQAKAQLEKEVAKNRNEELSATQDDLANRTDDVIEQIRDLPDGEHSFGCLLYTSPSPRDGLLSRMPSSA